jgi:ribose transport system permease protein
MNSEDKAGARVKRNNIIKQLYPVIGTIFVIVLFEIMSGGKLLTAKSIQSMYNQAFPILICAVAGVFVMATGNLDFSIGANMGFCATLGCFIAFLNPYLTFPACLLIGIGVGFAVGCIQVYAKIPSFIACLCMMFILQAITQTLTNGSTKMLPTEMMMWKVDGIKIVFLIVYLIGMVIVFNFTRVGKSLKAMGISQEASTQSGIRCDRMIILSYCITGGAAGCAGFFSLMRTYCASYMTGQTMMIDVIIAIVLGGMAVSGGASSKISAAIFGTIITTVLSNGITLAGLGGEYSQLIRGIIFVIIVAITVDKSKGSIIK